MTHLGLVFFSVLTGAVALSDVSPSWAQAGPESRPNIVVLVADDNTDRITGVLFTSKIPPLRNSEISPAEERWGRQGPT